MRNWNGARKLVPPQQAKALRAFLWGIETWLCILHILSNLQVASLPMRNWNPSPFALKGKAFRVASLPMRNWNSASSISSNAVNFTLRAFLWGIETTSRALPKGFRFYRCEPSYEELKRSFMAPLTAWTPSRCEPSYEELKQEMGIKWWIRWSRCEPSYEELKHSI